MRKQRTILFDQKVCYLCPAGGIYLQMHELDDSALLRVYVERDSEEAFATLVARHVNKVYSVALRHTGNPHSAEEITQAVFVILARKARRLRHGVILSGWLFQTARLTSITFIRGEIRRVRREQEAHLQTELNEQGAAAWNQIAPLLDTAIANLNEKDRHAIVLRFFDGKSMKEVGADLGATEDAAKNRISRAVEKLRRFFTKRGVPVSAVVLTTEITSHAVQVAPEALARTAAAIATAKSLAAGGSTALIIKGALKAMAWAKWKLACALSTATVVVASLVTVAVAQTGGGSSHPDPVALLKGVAAARNKIKSGEMELLVARHDFKWAIQTNYSYLKVAFDGKNRRFEQMQRESVLTSMEPDAGKIADAKRIELNGDDEALARLGLIRFQDAHYRAIYNGETITRFDPRLDTSIDDPKKGSFTWLFDPRTLGLSDATFPNNTIENCLSYDGAQSVSLVGKEDLEGTPVWHIKVQVAEDWRYEFWLDAAHPTHVLKQEAPNRAGMVLSKFDPQHPEDPIPVEVNFIAHYGGEPQPWYTRMLRRKTRYNVPIDPKAWTLAGLGMPPGTAVHDDRILKRIGYWTGAALDENFPRNAKPRPRDEASVLDNDPAVLAMAKNDGSFVDERKIVVRRIGIGIGSVMALAVLSLGSVLAVKRFRKAP